MRFDNQCTTQRQLGGFGGRGRWRISNNCAERTPLEGRKPELGQHGCAGIATLELHRKPNFAQALGRHWHGCLCREARDGLQGLSDKMG